MALRIKCRCGKQMQIASRLAGKRLACSACGWKFSIPPERFEAATSVAKIPPPDRPGIPAAPSISADFGSDELVATPAAPSPAHALDEEPADLDLDSAIADLSGLLTSDIENAATDELELADELPDRLEREPLATSAESPTSSSMASGNDAAEVSYARDGFTRPLAARASVKDIIQGPTRTFWADAFHSFVYPCHNGNNAITFAVVCFVSLLRIPLGWVGIYGLAGIFIIYGWLCALYLSVVQETAVASEDLPGIRMEQGFIEDILKPMLKYIGAFATALAPATIYLILMAVGLVPDALSSGFALVCWMALGFFLLPVFVLLFAFNALDMIYRVDLIFTTVYRTFRAYVAIWFLLLLVGFTWTIPLAIALLAELDLDLSLPTLPFAGPVFEAGMNVLDVYLTIVSMRLIGLYYLHFKRRFTIVFE